jgi:hypothetical protein
MKLLLRGRVVLLAAISSLGLSAAATLPAFASYIGWDAAVRPPSSLAGHLVSAILGLVR